MKISEKMGDQTDEIATIIVVRWYDFHQSSAYNQQQFRVRQYQHIFEVYNQSSPLKKLSEYEHE